MNLHLMNPDPEISQLLELVFTDFQNDLNWKKFKGVLIDRGYRVFPKYAPLKDASATRIITSVHFNKKGEINSFLKNEINLAMEMQKYEIASSLRDFLIETSKQKDVEFYLDYLVVPIGEKNFELWFETDLLSFKYRLYRELTIL